jgi:3-phosphoshikimate 1-carboxyvinyltransferase
VRARELVLDALNGREIEIEDENDDIFVLSRALYNAQLSGIILDLKASGTALRFLTAYCAVTEGEWVLSGTERLCERPIRPLVDALRGMGAEIEYVEKEGFAPLRIVGRKLKGGRVRLDASLSSQFASALMLISDKVEGGVEIEYEGDVASQSYIRLTENVIEKYRSGVRYSGERDWSSATVWYAVMAVLKEGRFLFEGLSLDSCQPDRKIVEVFEKLGVKTKAVENGVEIESGGVVVDKLELDCKNMPDAVMYIAVAACLLGVEFEISGVETLRVKESDRIEALINEMRKCGYLIQCIMHNAQCTIFVEHESRHKEVIHNSQLDGQVPRIKTYNDHRIAMSMAVVGLIREIEIENREVVNKSYPEFWREFDRVKNIYCK